MPAREDVLVMCARESEVAVVPQGLQRAKETALCEFGCGQRVIYNRFNVGEIRSKGNRPVLICMTCYSQGAHIKQGYRKV